jgi:glycosyltransferase involved in cell wall biosynthesis
MKISIVIPTFNEEKYLPTLLDSIKEQSFTDYEIIIADANSTDKTVKIAKKYKAKVVKGGLPARGRNNGAKAAKGEFLYFFDADMILPKDFLKNADEEIEEKFVDIATCEVLPESELIIDHILYNLANLSIKLSQFTNPHAVGQCIIITKRLFNRIGGFDEKLELAEDHNFAYRASKFRRLKILESAKIINNVRRLDKEGRMVLAAKYITTEVQRAFQGEIRKKIYSYDFGKYSEQNKKDSLKEFELKIRALNKNLNKYLATNPSTSDFYKRFSTFQDQFNDLTTKFKKELNKWLEE